MTAAHDEKHDKRPAENNVDLAEMCALVKQMHGKLTAVSTSTASMDVTLKEMQQDLTGVKSEIRSIKSTIDTVTREQLNQKQSLGLMEQRVGSMQKVLDGDYRNHPYTVMRKLRQRFFYVPSFRAAGRSYLEQVQETVSRLSAMFSEQNVRLPEDIFRNVSLERYSATAVKNNPALAERQMVVVTLPDTKYLGILGAVSKQISDKHGVYWRMELTPVEQSAQTRIRKSAAFKKACGKLPVGQKPLWLFDKAIVGKGQGAQVWTVERAERSDQRMSDDAGVVEMSD